MFLLALAFLLCPELLEILPAPGFVSTDLLRLGRRRGSRFLVRPDFRFGARLWPRLLSHCARQGASLFLQSFAGGLQRFEHIPIPLTAACILTFAGILTFWLFRTG